jgi:hypothetical protein
MRVLECGVTNEIPRGPLQRTGIPGVKARTTDLTDEVPYCEVAQVALRPVMNTIHAQGQHGLPRT